MSPRQPTDGRYLLFGFDTAVINGAVDAIKVWSGAASWLLGFAVAGALLGSASVPGSQVRSLIATAALPS